MSTTKPFSAKYFVNLLKLKQAGDCIERIGTTLFNSKIKLTPHQIEAALFAFKSPLSSGCILADEVGLGKTIEAGIVLAQFWNEHKRKILIVAPASLMRQWSIELFEKFALPSIIMDRKNYKKLQKEGNINPFLVKNNIIICSYQMCASLSADIKNAGFDLCIIDEAHKLRNVWTGKNIISLSIKEALLNTKKVLLTATPIQNNVMDLFGLTSLIDDNIFGDDKIYKEKYHKNYSTNLPELRNRLHNFTHRTLREQVQPYIKFTQRIPKTFTFVQTEDELKVYNAIRELLLSSNEDSYLIPHKQKHLLLLILCKLMGSSIHSIVYTLETMKKRLEHLLSTGSDDGMDDILNLEIDDDLLDEETDIEDTLDENTEQKIDKIKLNKEIQNLNNIIEIARKINDESKYIALKKAICYGFDFLKELNANEKILIFTESKRTQKYLYDSLIKDGFEGVVTFNGSNNDELSTRIFEEWCSKPENYEKLNNSKSVNLRQAIIDYFKEKGKILIATGAGAEGLNIQFCSMVVNYDLPWNPQVVEQRIGRCHRFGQEHDVAVINFISSTNVVEQRIYELLSSKFKVFNEVFGSSDSILGVLEDGIDLQKAIIDIYTKCRSTEEINNAFDEIQEQFKDVIDESIKKTKHDLIENFDEDLQNYFDDIMEKTQKSIDKIEQLFWALTKAILDTKAIFSEQDKTFKYNNASYCLSTVNTGHYIDYNMTSVLGSKVIETANELTENCGHITFDITNYPYKIASIMKLKGQHGYLSLNKITINSFEQEEYLFFNGFLDNNLPIDEDIIEKLFRLNTQEKSLTTIASSDICKRLCDDAALHSKKIIIQSEERNNILLNEEITRINNWAEDKIEAVQLKVELMRNERKNLQKQSDIAENTYEKQKLEEDISKLSKKIKLAWLELADAEDEIEHQRKTMISKLRDQLMKTVSTETLFTVSFDIV